MGPVGAASVDLPGVRLGVGSDKSLPIASTGARAKRGVIWGGLSCALRFMRPGPARPTESPTAAAPSLPSPQGARSCTQACPHLTPILPLRYFSMTGARRTLPTGEGAGIISARFISSFRSARSPALRAARQRLGVPVPLLCLSKRSCVPVCAKRVSSPAVSPKTGRQEWKPKLS